MSFYMFSIALKNALWYYDKCITIIMLKLENCGLKLSYGVSFSDVQQVF